MSATDEAERERTAVAATAAVEANQYHDELGSTITETASEIAAMVLLPGELSLFHHSSSDFAYYYPTYYARAHLIDSTAVVALLDSATNRL